MANEVELKFDVEPGGADAVRAAPPFAAAAAAQARLETAYYDTPDGELRKAGFSLRLRRSEGRIVQTVKRKRGRSAGLFVRREWESEVDRLAIDRERLAATPVARRVKDGLDRLAPVIRTLIERSLWEVERGGSRIEAVLDVGRIVCGKREAPISELELELKEGQAQDLFALAEEIAASAPLRLGVLSKNERGEALAEGRLGRAAKAEPLKLRPPLTQAEAFHAIARACLRHFRLNEMVLLERGDADALHQARVALRRLRSAMSLFRPTVRGADYQLLREGLRWLAGRLGEARNLDVLLVRLAGLGVDDPKLRAPPLRARDKAYARATAALRSERARRLMLKLAVWIETGAWRFRGSGKRDLAALAERQLDRQWRRICRRGDGLAGLGPDGRHRLRLDVKKLRYAAEFLAPLHAEKPRSARRDRFIAALKGLQERLGELNDAWTGRQLGARLPRRLQAVLAGAHDDANERSQLRAADKAFRRASGAAGYWRAGQGA